MIDIINFLIKKSNKEYWKKILYYKYPNTEALFKKPVAIFGAGRMGKVFLKGMRSVGMRVSYFIDNSRKLQGNVIDRVPVISLFKAKKISLENPVVVASLSYETEICTDLLKEGFKFVFPLVYLNTLYPDIFFSPEYKNIFDSLFEKDNQTKIQNAMDLWEDEKSKEVFSRLLLFRFTFEKAYLRHANAGTSSYICDGLLRFGEKEVFVDGGAYTGDSIDAFLEASHKKYMSIYSFEPDETNYTHLVNYCRKRGMKAVFPVKKGMFEKTGQVRFNGNGTVDARILKKINNSVHNHDIKRIETVILDDYFRDKETPTLIKMDIEGVEREALMGASKLIRLNKPKLMISVYHHAEDLWNLPILIKKLNPMYRLHLRHFSNEITDTLCYAY